MKIITLSDLHLEFAHNWLPSPELEGDVLILAGDIISFKDFRPLNRLLKNWQKPVIYIAGNHEYYTKRPIDEGNEVIREWLNDHHPQVQLLLDEATSIEGVHFFGGTMWTDFNQGNHQAMRAAADGMNDFRYIRKADNSSLTPEDTLILHQQFKDGLIAWFERPLDGPRVVITHHAPVINPNTKYADSLLRPAFNSLDMVEIIEEYQPALWIYGHTHECDDQRIGKTRIVSNQLGYSVNHGGFECSGFDPAGLPIDIAV